MTSPNDTHYMRHALRLAARGLGNTWPNPTVGAVVVRDNVIVGTGTTARGGRPHAETMALEEAGDKAKGATLYVTLEPCAHHGKTPPCTEAIIKAGIKHVVAGCTDPNTQVSGKGFAQLREAGIEVTEKILEGEARALNEGFFSVVERNRPFITLKIATSLDGKTATKNGESKWITGEESRKRGHLLRAEHDAILTGIGTVLDDEPELTCRIAGREGDSPQRVILDGTLRVPEKAKTLPAWIFTSPAALKKNAAAAAALKKIGSTVFTAPVEGKHLFLAEVTQQLSAQGITRLLVEAGGTLATSFLKARLIDRIYWFRAPLIIGGGGINSAQELDLTLAQTPRYTLMQTERLGNDSLDIYDCGVV